MQDDRFNLSRFEKAQETMYSVALKELRAGRKLSHWMWYVFPQLKHLGHSYNAKFYGISSLEEAVAYLAHPVLGERLREVSEVILGLDGDDAVEVFGRIDARKLRSSMTLFDAASPDDLFSKVLDKYFEGRSDRRTLSILSDNHLGSIAGVATMS